MLELVFLSRPKWIKESFVFKIQIYLPQNKNTLHVLSASEYKAQFHIFSHLSYIALFNTSVIKHISQGH